MSLLSASPTSTAAAAAKRRGEAGFTLMEILAALTVFLIGVVGVISLLASGTAMHRSSQQLGDASDLVEEVVLRVEKELLEAPRSAQGDLPVGPSAPLAMPGHPGMLYRWEVRAGDLAPPYLLDIEIYWQEGGQVRSLKTHRALVELMPQALEVRRSRSRSDKGTTP